MKTGILCNEQVFPFNIDLQGVPCKPCVFSFSVGLIICQNLGRGRLPLAPPPGNDGPATTHQLSTANYKALTANFNTYC